MNLSPLFIGLLLWWGGVMPALASRTFSVAPSRMVFEWPAQKSRSIVLTNTGDSPLRLAIEPIFFTAEDEALQAGTLLDPAAAYTDSLASWMVLSPRTVVLGPGQARHIRVSLRPPLDLSPGDYRAHVLIRMLDAPPPPTVSSEPKMAMALDVNVETAVAVYAQIGVPQKTLSLRCMRTSEGIRIEGDNGSVWNIDSLMEIWAGNTKVSTQHWLHLRNTHKTELLKMALPTAPITLKLTGAPAAEYLCE